MGFVFLGLHFGLADDFFHVEGASLLEVVGPLLSLLLEG